MTTQVDCLIDGAKATGYVLITQPQQWDDFLAGISEVKGFEGETALNRSIEDSPRAMPGNKEVEDFRLPAGVQYLPASTTRAPRRVRRHPR